MLLTGYQVRLLREKNTTYQQQIVKVREHAEHEFKLKEEKYQSQIKELKKEAESAKIQLVMKVIHFVCHELFKLHASC